MKKIILAIWLGLMTIGLLGQLQFDNIASLIGINHSYEGVIGGGVSFCDFNGDGLDDLTLASGEGSAIHFYVNNGNGFSKIPSLVPHFKEAKQILWVDFDNDQDQDLFVAGYGCPNRLYKNEGNLELVDITEAAGLPLNDYNTFGACFGDIDRDGWLDLYYSERIPFMTPMNQHYLFKNNADSTFSDITESSQSADLGKVPFCSSFFDYNNDKWPDIYTANDKYAHPNTLLGNNGDGTFSDVGMAANADLNMDAMCVNVGDYNNDGWSDIYVTNTPAGSALLHNIGPVANDQVIFGNAAQFAGVGFMGGIGWGSVFLDADNDGDLDLYVSGANEGADAVSSAFYLNLGNSTFSEPYAGFAGDTTKSFNNAIGDFNNDGFPDIMVVNQAPYKSSLWQNAGGDYNWIKIKLIGVLSNRDGIGSKIEIYHGGNYQMKYTHAGNGFLGQNSKTEIIGLNNNEMADSIIVTWPTGHIDKLYNVEKFENIELLEGTTTNGTIEVDDDVELTVLVSNNINKFLNKNIQLNIYPSPATELLNIETVDHEFSFYLIINNNGQIMQTIKNPGNSTSLYIAHFSVGYYTVIAFDKHGSSWPFIWFKK